jgi:hypothetical protein
MGPAAAGVRDLVEAELAAVRRHNAVAYMWSSAQVRDDEALLRGCRDALARM